MASHPEPRPRRRGWLWLAAAVGVLVVVGVGAAIRASLSAAAYLREARLAEAKLHVRRVAEGGTRCATEERRFSGIAPAVPATLDQVRGRHHTSQAQDWDHPAYRCSGFTLSMRPSFRIQCVATGRDEGVARADAEPDGGGVARLVVEAAVTCLGDVCVAAEPVLG